MYQKNNELDKIRLLKKIKFYVSLRKRWTEKPIRFNVDQNSNKILKTFQEKNFYYVSFFYSVGTFFSEQVLQS